MSLSEAEKVWRRMRYDRWVPPLFWVGFDDDDFSRWPEGHSFIGWSRGYWAWCARRLQAGLEVNGFGPVPDYFVAWLKREGFKLRDYSPGGILSFQDLRDFVAGEPEGVDRD